MDVSIDETRNNEACRGVDFVVDMTFKFLADEDDFVAFVNEFGVSPKIVPIIVVADEPSASDACRHLEKALV
jgi:hypothetical protein